jgi:hypothetical protein
MAQTRDNEKILSTKSPKKRLWIIFIIISVFILGLLFWRFFFYQSVDEQLAAIEAARAIPDSENAAFYYRQFFNEPNNVSALEDLSSYTPSATREPWHDSEFPELATLLKTNRQLLQTLVDISEMQEARFQIYPDPMSDSNSMSALIRRATFILSWAAANDLAEGRIDEALSKIRCQIRLACHLEQHPVSIYRLVGIAIEAVGLHNIRVAAIHGGLTHEQLNSLAAIVAIPKSYTEPDPQLVEKLDRLVSIKQRSTLSPIARLQAWWQERRAYESSTERKHVQQIRLLSVCRGTEILIALRRFKDKNSHWPESLDEIKSMVAENTLIDPTNNNSYVYKLTDDGFVLYSKGENNIDEGGRYGFCADDRPIWPLQIK